MIKCNNNNWILEFGGEFENKENNGKYAKNIQKNIFITKQFDSNGKRKKIKKQRKFKSDDIRKKRKRKIKNLDLKL